MVAGATGLATGTRLSWSGEATSSGVPIGVIDGMGGYAGGAEAAAIVASGLATINVAQIGQSWDAWFEALSDRVTQAGQAWGTPDMGATTALLIINSSGLWMANVGDCRIYRVIGGHLGQLSVDDRTGDPDSSAVTQALGGSTRIDAHAWRQAYKGGRERFVLCSDGVWGTLDPAVLRDLCAAERSPNEIADAIITSIYAQNATDNCSVIIVDLTATSVAEVPDSDSTKEQSVWPIDVRNPSDFVSGRRLPL
jgi:serine/threonine protein phosphatase PrpC